MLQIGSRGQEVIELQQALEIEVDGYFGDDTRKAVEAYQQENSLIVDGIVGSQTLEAIRENNVTEVYGK